MILFETERLLFRSHEPADREAYCAMEQDPEVRRFVGGAPRTREAAEAKFAAVLEPTPDRLRLWATVLRQSGCYIGRCGIYPHFEGDTTIPGEGVLAFYLARPYWSQGFATEAGAAFVQFGFGELRLRKIIATVQEGNSASIRALNKLGFVLARIEPGPRTFHHFALARPERHS